ncbi:kinase-like domain-containing protein [Earliella scabrosa]|nr:kinase-like domain-containing protein [Earliella scabrosa]
MSAAEMAILQSHQKQPTQAKPVTFMVAWEVRRSDATKNTDADMGTSCKPFDQGMRLIELLHTIIDCVNGTWLRRYSEQITPEDTELRVPGNVNIPRDEMNQSIKEWYDAHNVDTLRDTYIIPPRMGGVRKKKGPDNRAFSLEVYVHIDKLQERMKNPESLEKRMQKRVNKRKPDDVQSDLFSDSPKKVKQTAPYTSRSRLVAIPGQLRTVLQTSWGSRPINSGENTVSRIRFKRTTCHVDSTTGNIRLEESTAEEHGELSKEPLKLAQRDMGLTKQVFMLTINGEKYAAKKLVNTGERRGSAIDLEDQVKLLTCDLVRLKRMEELSKSFVALAHEKLVPICRFEVSGGFLIKLYTEPAKSTLSENSTGQEAETPDMTQEEAVSPPEVVSAVYLVEPYRRNQSVMRYSGTLGAGRTGDQRSTTMAAFAHYMAQETGCSCIFADIQASEDIDNVENLILFDPMTHTPSKDSGLGDCGWDGLQSFVTSHACNDACTRLELCSEEVLQDTVENFA